MKRLFRNSLIALAIFACNAPVALAKWNKDWTERTQVILNTSATGLATKGAVNQLTVPVRLHTGNFEFAKAKPDGSDLRFIAADDKTELAHQIEYFDPANELAVIWVAIPTLLPNAVDQKVFLYFGNAAAPAAVNGAKTFDSSALAVVQGPAADGTLADTSPAQSNIAAQGVSIEPSGVLGSAIRLTGNGSVTVSGPNVKLGTTGATASFWIKSAAATVTGSMLKISAEGGTIEVRADAGVIQLVSQGAFGALNAKAAAATPLTSWTHIALVIGEKTVVAVNGVEVASLATKPVVSAAQFQFGNALAADFDSLQIFGVTRSNEWLAANFAAQNADGKMIRVEAATEAASEAGYLKILIDNLPLDAIIIIVLLGVMALVAIWVVVDKSLTLKRANKANREFLKQYQSLGSSAFVSNTIAAGVQQKGYADSTLYHVYDKARAALIKRIPDGKAKLEQRNMPALKAAVDTAVVGQNSRMNRWMVLLTIAISGGPFLGLLGTVVGVMITFAAIAAVGDVNINAIAPGIAAALLATVAGLAVAIPALFAYNYLASEIKEITTNTAVFGEEVLSDMSEIHGT